jgi:hypothetical protein
MLRGRRPLIQTTLFEIFLFGFICAAPTFVGTTRQHTNIHAARNAAQMSPSKETSSNIFLEEWTTTPSKALKF